MAPIQRSPGLLLDTRRLGAAVAFPGIDPRHWISLAIVTAMEIDPVEGPFVSCTLLPTQQQVTARVGSGYAGGGFGDWCPIRVDDEVLIEAPDGEAMGGYIVTARLWSPADPPPALMASNPGDRLIQAMPGTTMRVVADQLNLGTGDAAQASVRGTLYRTNQKTLDTTLETQLTALATAATAMAAAMTTLSPLIGTATFVPSSNAPLAAAAVTAAGVGATAMAAAATALSAAVLQFETGDTAETPYLQPQVAVP